MVCGLNPTIFLVVKPLKGLEVDEDQMGEERKMVVIVVSLEGEEDLQ